MKKTQAYISLAITAAVISVAGIYAQQALSKTTPTGGLSVNGIAIPQERINAFVKNQTAQGTPESPEMLNAIKKHLVRLELVSQEAKKKGLEKNAEVADTIAMARQQILYSAYLQDYVKAHPINEAELKKTYDAQKAQMANEKEYKVRHILVDKEEDAKAIIADLSKGSDFNKLAKEKSKDQGTKEQGGDLDWALPGRFVPPFADALKSLQKGQTTQKPVQTNFGFHVIKVEDIRDVKVPPFDQVKQQILQQAQQDQVQKLLSDMESKAKIVDAK